VGFLSDLFGGGGSQSYVSGYRYYAGLQLAFCHFADKILRIDVGDKIAWTGDASSNTTIYIGKPELFGGEGKEGGIVGNVDVCFGAPSQDKNPYLVRVLGTSIMPAYRGLLTLVANKVMVSANNPYIKEWSLMAQRTNTGWLPDYERIVASDGYTDMNPAHMIRECLTSSTWGTLGYPEADIDNSSFQACALTLWHDKMGLSLLWGKDSSIDALISIIQDHIDAIVYFSHVTGKLKMKLIRNDYIVAGLKVLNESNILELVDFTTPSSTDMINQVIVTYVDRENRPGGITVQDIAGINRCSGKINSITTHMPGFATAEWAGKIASRELQQGAVPISTCTLIVNRKGFLLEEGDCFVFDWADVGITGMVMRIVTVEIGAIDDSPLRITAVRDTYGLGAVAFTQPQSSNWSIPRNPPADALRRKLFEMTWWQFVVDLYGDSAAVLAEIDNSSSILCCVCGQPSNDSVNYEIWSRNIGAPAYEYRTTTSFPFIGTLSVSIAPELQSTITITESYLDSNMVKVGKYAMIEDEWVSIVSVDPVTKSVVVNRGVLDTIPVTHPAGSPIWLHQGLFGVDGKIRAVGENVEVKFLPATGLGRLPIGGASTNSILLTGRMMRPYPPGNVKVNGTRWPTVIGLSEINVSWSHRDRITQTVTFNTQDEADIGPEIGTTYNLRFYGETGTLVRNLTGLTTTSYQYFIGDELADKGYTFTDPSWASVVLAMPMGGLNNSTVFTDIKRHSVTSAGTPVISTTQSKFGGSSAYFDGSGDLLSTPSSIDFDLADVDFTIEFYAYFINGGHGGSYCALLEIGNQTDAGCLAIISDAGYSPAKIRAIGYNAGEVSLCPTLGADISNDAWHHIALSKSGDTYRTYVDGTLYGTVTSTYTHSQYPITIGSRATGSNSFYGYIDNLRITKGVARYTANFTPPGAIIDLAAELNTTVRIELESVRDSLTSLNKWDLTVGRL